MIQCTIVTHDTPTCKRGLTSQHHPCCIIPQAQPLHAFFPTFPHNISWGVEANPSLSSFPLILV